MFTIKFESVRRLTAWACVFVCALLLLALGPSFQQHVLALLTSPNSSLYQSVYKDALIKFPSFGEWLVAVNYPLYSIGAAALTWCVFRSKSMRGALALMSVTLIVFLNVLDFTVNWWVGNLNYAYWVECFVGNLVGAPLTAALLVVIVWLAQRARTGVSEHVQLAAMVGAVLPAVCGVLIFLSQYYALALFFKPTPSYIDAKASPKFGAGYMLNADVKKRRAHKEAEECACDLDQKEEEDFAFLEGTFKGGLLFQGVAEKATLEWRASGAEAYELSITAVDGCLKEELPDSSAPRWSAFKVKGLRKFSVEIDKGAITLGSKADFGNIHISNSEIFPTWTQKEKDGGSLSRFMLATDRVSYGVNGSSQKIALQMPLFTMSEKYEVASAPKFININVDGRERSFVFNPASTKSSADTCAPYNLSSFSATSAANISRSGVVKLVLEVRRIDSGDMFGFVKNSPFEISGIVGWLTANKLDFDRVSALITPGVLQGLQLAGKIDYLRLNGEDVQGLDSRQFSFYNGTIKARAVDAGSMLYQGVADWIWVDGKRLNKTRWESFDGATQGILLSLLGLLLIGFLKTLHICIRDNDSYSL